MGVSLTKWLAAFLGCALCLTASAEESAKHRHPENIARGCPYTLHPAPNYLHTKDDNDLRDLTDGVYEKDPALWTHKTSVGWMFSTPIITIDLGHPRAITGLRFSTAAGDGGVSFLRQLFLFVSDDGVHWKAVGNDLAARSEKINGAPRNRKNQAAFWRYKIDGLKASGRYVAVVPAPDCENRDDKNYVFCDEIEIFGGKKIITEEGGPDRGDMVAIPGEGRKAIETFVRQQRTTDSARKRMTNDLGTVSAALQDAPLSDQERETLKNRLTAAKKQIKTFEVTDPSSFETTFPLAPAHEKIFSVYGRLLKAKGFPETVLWKQHRYLLPPHLTPPPKDSPDPRLDITMMRDEYRADSLNITNASGESMQVSLAIRNLPETKGWLRVAAIPWTDTLQHQPVAAALPWLEDGKYQFSVPAGMTRKLWFHVNGSGLPPGLHEGLVEIESPSGKKQAPFSVRVSTVALGRPKLAVSLWDYANGADALGITRKNTSAAIALMRECFVNGTWAYGSILPLPAGQPGTPDFANFDRWLALWPGVEHYLVFLNAKEEFDGVKISDPAFVGRVGAWMKKIAEHLDKKNISRERLVLELVDEPHTDRQDAIIAAWAEAIKAAVPEFQIFENPTWLHPGQTPIQKAMKLPDIICPYVFQYEKGGEATKKYFADRPGRQRLWFYLCAGPVRIFDPTNYYRSKAWWAFENTGEGLLYWAFGSIGGDLGLGASGSNWNEYDSIGPNFSPVFIRPDNITSGVHMEALREGVQDYQYLVKLRDGMTSPPDENWKQEAAELLQAAPKQVADGKPFDLPWAAAKASDVAAPDDFRVKILALLEKLQNQ